MNYEEIGFIDKSNNIKPKNKVTEQSEKSSNFDENHNSNIKNQ